MVYPEAIAKMPVAPIWSILFFAMIVTLGIGTQIAIVTTVVSAIVDSSAKLVARRLWVTLVFCIVGFLVGTVWIGTRFGFLRRVEWVGALGFLSRAKSF